MKYFALLITLILWSFKADSHVEIEDYKLTTDSVKIMNDDGNRYLLISAKLTNNSNDTLKYISWTCSPAYNITVESKKLTKRSSAPIDECLRNLPIVETLLPHSSIIIPVKLRFLEGANASSAKFRLGIRLIILKENEDILQAINADRYQILWARRTKWKLDS